MDQIKIGVIPGDGIGPKRSWRKSVKVLREIEHRLEGVQFELRELDVGAAAIFAEPGKYCRWIRSRLLRITGRSSSARSVYLTSACRTALKSRPNSICASNWISIAAFGQLTFTMSDIHPLRATARGRSNLLSSEKTPRVCFLRDNNRMFRMPRPFPTH